MSSFALDNWSRPGPRRRIREPGAVTFASDTVQFQEGFLSSLDKPACATASENRW